MSCPRSPPIPACSARPSSTSTTAAAPAVRDAFFDQFITKFFSVGNDLKVTESQRQEPLALCRQSDQEAALGCMEACGTTDFREFLKR